MQIVSSHDDDYILAIGECNRFYRKYLYIAIAPNLPLFGRFIAKPVTPLG